MKNFIIISLFACHLVACNNNSETKTTEPSTISNSRLIDSLNWLIGNWKGESSRGVIQENWIKVNDSLFDGEAYVINNNDTSLFENITIEQRGNYLYYVPVVDKAVDFRMTSYGNKQVIFVNNEHDFPQKITYQLLPGDSLVAEISGTQDGKTSSQQYRFKKQ